MFKGFAFFVKTSNRRHWNIVSFHSPHSLTWSWILSFRFFAADEARVRPFGWRYRDNNGLQWGFRIPWIGFVQWHRQQPMLFSRLCRRAWEERDALRSEIGQLRYPAPHEIPSVAERPAILH